MDLCRARGATAIVRGLRAMSDFETEMQLADNNRVLAPGASTRALFFICRRQLATSAPASSSYTAAFGGDVSTTVPAAPRTALAEALREALTLTSPAP